MSDDVKNRIETDIKSHKVLAYVKGTKQQPMCGFSKAVIDVFEDLGVDFETRDVLSDPEIREGIKRYTSWPTIPQIFINGEFVGGCDIIRDLYESGELEQMVNKATGK